MGGTSSTKQTQTSSIDPYAPATPALNSALSSWGLLAPTAGTLTGAQSGALGTIEANAAKGNPYAGTIADVTKGLLGGGGAQNNDAAIKGNLSGYNTALEPYANGSKIGANSDLKPVLDTVRSDITNQVAGQFAAAGRSGSPDEYQALGRGFAQGAAPIVASQFNTDTQRMLDANAAKYGAGNTSYGILNGTQQTASGNAATGVAMAPTALDAQNYGANSILQAEAQRWGIPASQLTTVLGAVLPAAQGLGTQNGTATGQNTMSGAQQFATIANGIGSLWPKQPTTFNFG